VAGLDLTPQPVSGPSAHASLRAKDVKFVNAASLSSDGFASNEFSADLTAHIELPDETNYLAEYIIVSKSKGEHA
jgi:hypothetical protein